MTRLIVLSVAALAVAVVGYFAWVEYERSRVTALFQETVEKTRDYLRDLAASQNEETPQPALAGSPMILQHVELIGNDLHFNFHDPTPMRLPAVIPDIESFRPYGAFNDDALEIYGQFVDRLCAEATMRSIFKFGFRIQINATRETFTEAELSRLNRMGFRETAGGRESWLPRWKVGEEQCLEAGIVVLE